MAARPTVACARDSFGKGGVLQQMHDSRECERVACRLRVTTGFEHAIEVSASVNAAYSATWSAAARLSHCSLLCFGNAACQSARGCVALLLAERACHTV